MLASSSLARLASGLYQSLTSVSVSTKIVGGVFALGLTLGSVAWLQLRFPSEEARWAAGLVVSALVVGLCAAALARTVVVPIRSLTRMVDRIRQADLGARARVYYHDEIGELASAFNQMAERLAHSWEQLRREEQGRRALIDETVQVLENERKSLSRELHDQLGHSLLSPLTKLQASCPYASQPDCGCAEVQRGIRHLIAEVHRLASGMRPSILDHCGLDAALERYARTISRSEGLKIDFQSFGQQSRRSRLPSQVELSLYRVAQEAVTNIVRHAEARHASIVLIKDSNQVSLVIEDDGLGFDPPRAPDGEDGLGLIGMRERALLLGGDFTIDSRPGAGTVARVTIPIGGDRR